jgi:hypothetical protein
MSFLPARSARSGQASAVIEDKHTQWLQKPLHSLHVTFHGPHFSTRTTKVRNSWISIRGICCQTAQDDLVERRINLLIPGAWRQESSPRGSCI